MGRSVLPFERKGKTSILKRDTSSESASRSGTMGKYPPHDPAVLHFSFLESIIFQSLDPNPENQNKYIRTRLIEARLPTQLYSLLGADRLQRHTIRPTTILLSLVPCDGLLASLGTHRVLWGLRSAQTTAAASTKPKTTSPNHPPDIGIKEHSSNSRPSCALNFAWCMLAARSRRQRLTHHHTHNHAHDHARTRERDREIEARPTVIR